MPTAIRDLIREGAVFAASTFEMTETIVGNGSAKRVPAHEIRHDLPGGRARPQPLRVRSYRLDRDDPRRIAEATASMCVGVPGIGDGLRVRPKWAFE